VKQRKRSSAFRRFVMVELLVLLTVTLLSFCYALHTRNTNGLESLAVFMLPAAAILTLLVWPLSSDDRLEPGSLAPLRRTYLFYSLFVALVVALLLSSMFWLGNFAQVKVEQNLTRAMLRNDRTMLTNLVPAVQKLVATPYELSHLLDHAVQQTNAARIPGGFLLAKTDAGVCSAWGSPPEDAETFWNRAKNDSIIHIPTGGRRVWTRSYMTDSFSLRIGGEPVHVLVVIPITSDLFVTGLFLGRPVWLIILLGTLLAFIVTLSFGRIAARPATAALERLAQFTSDAGHELKTPLAAIQLNAEMALRPQSTPEQPRSYTEATLRQARAASETVQSLLLLARLPHTAAQPGAPVPFSILCTDVQQSLAPLLERKDLRLDVAGADVMVPANRDLMLIILKNLVQNAAQWSPAGAAIGMSAHMALRRRIQISVTDHGQGIPAKDLPHIFERFYRADPSHGHTQHGGAGLGLAIVKQAVSCMRGSVHAVSVPGSGTTLILLLPR
jgi:signal transduction histidine kinase